LGSCRISFCGVYRQLHHFLHTKRTIPLPDPCTSAGDAKYTGMLNSVHSSSLFVPFTGPGNAKGKSVSCSNGSQVRRPDYSGKKDFPLPTKKT